MFMLLLAKKQKISIIKKRRSHQAWDDIQFQGVPQFEKVKVLKPPNLSVILFLRYMLIFFLFFLHLVFQPFNRTTLIYAQKQIQFYLLIVFLIINQEYKSIFKNIRAFAHTLQLPASWIVFSSSRQKKKIHVLRLIVSICSKLKNTVF